MSEQFPSIAIVAAMAENRVIGDGNRLPWHLPADLAHFKRLTMGKPMIMGRRTWESLPGLLPGRPHIVVTRNTRYIAPGARLAHSLEDALALAVGAEQVMIVGGAELYAQALPLAQHLYLTLVHAKPRGDIVFPDYVAADWREVSREERLADDTNAFALTFLELERVDAR